MNDSNIGVTNVTIRLEERKVSKYIKYVYIKKSNTVVTNVIMRLHTQVISGDRNKVYMVKSMLI